VTAQVSRPTDPRPPTPSAWASLSRNAGEGLKFVAESAAVFGGRVDHLADFGDLGRRKAADLGVLFDDVLVFREIDAERLVGGDIALDPLDVGAELAQDVVRFCRRAAQLLAIEAAGCRNVAFDDEFAQSHLCLPLLAFAADDIAPMIG